MTVTRRHALLGFGAAVLAGCSREHVQERGAPAPPPSLPPSGSTGSAGSTGKRGGLPPGATRTDVREGIEMVSLFTGGADETSPVLVTIHGRGDRPEAWLPALHAFPGKAHVVVPRGIDPSEGGYSWFPLTSGMDDAALATVVAAAEERLFRAVSQLAAGRPLIVSGFSQGGMLSFAMAARRGKALTFAAPVAGMCPASLLPARGAAVAPIVAFHGTADPVIPFARGVAAVDGFRAQGHSAEMRPYEGVGHTLPDPMRTDIYAELMRRLVA